MVGVAEELSSPEAIEAASSGNPTQWLRTTNQILVAVGLALSTSSLTMRIYTKIRVMRSFWWDDTFIIMAWMISVGTQATILYGYTHGGFGLHITSLSPSTIVICEKVVFAAATIYISCLAFAKLALLMLYYRLLSAFQNWQYTLYVVAFFIAGYSVALTLALIFACSPIQKGWDASILQGSCINRPAVYLATAITNTVSDLILIFIPLRVVWGLHMPTIPKLGVIAIFGIGCLTIITSIVRLATLWPLVTSMDVSYKIALASVFIIIEANFIILCGSLPYFRQFIRHYAPTWFARGAGSKHFSSSSHSTPPRKVRQPRIDRVQDIEMAETRNSQPEYNN